MAAGRLQGKRLAGWRCICAGLLLLFVFSLGSGGASAASRAQARSYSLLAQAKGLCAILPNGKGFRIEPAVGDTEGTFACQSYDERTGKEHKFFYVEVQNYTTADSARAHVSSLPSQPGDPKWKLVSGFGDPGYAYEFPGYPSEKMDILSAKLEFARNCYVFIGDAGWENDGRNLTLNSLDEIRAVASSVDGALAGFPCEPSSGGGGGGDSGGGGEPQGETPTDTEIPTATASATPESDVNLTVDHVELVQVVQTADNSVPLVAGKTTVVRVFVQADAPDDRTIDGVSASLTIWPEGGSETEIKPVNPSISVQANTLPDRENIINGSINFRVPPELTSAGYFSVHAVVNPAHSIAENDYDDNDLREPFQFQQRDPLRVGYVRIGYKPPGETDMAWPGGALDTYNSKMNKLYPTADGSIQYYELPLRVRLTRPVSSFDLGDDLNWTLREYYDRMTDKPDIMFGWLPSQYSGPIPFGGLGETVLSGDVARVAIGIDTQTDYAPHVLAHEVAHDLGLEHTGTNDSGLDSGCKLAPNGSTSYWPAEYRGTGEIHEIGLDTKSLTIIPSTNFDLMDYCPYQKEWISPFHYLKLFAGNMHAQGAYTINSVKRAWIRGWAATKGGGATFVMTTGQAGSGQGPAPAQGSMLGSDRASMLVAGAVDRFTSPLLYPGESQASPVREGQGAYCLRFTNASGSNLYERCFDLPFVNAESGEPIDGQGFEVEVPYPDGATSVALVKDGQELAKHTASANPPTLNITSPKSGDSWQGEHTITWTGSDTDGDTLQYDVLYSPDGKQTWYPLQVHSADTSYTFSTDEILPSDQTYVRVRATDGFNTASTDVGPLSIPKQPNSPSPPPPPLPNSSVNPGGGSSGSGGGGGAGSSGFPSTGLLRQSPISLVWIVAAGVFALLVLIVIVLAMRSRRRQAVRVGPMPMQPMQPPAVAPSPTTPIYPPAAQAPGYPAAPPTYPAATMPLPPTQGTMQAPGYGFRQAEQQYAWLRGEMAGGRMAPAQYEAAVQQISVRDAQGRYWAMGSGDGVWYVYDGQRWLPAAPPS